MQGLPAALAHEVFGRFLDNCQKLPVQREACTAVLDLCKILCESYMNTEGETASKSIKAAIPGAKLTSRGGKREMIRSFRRILLAYLRSQDTDPFPSLEPSSASLVRSTICAC